LSKYGILWLSFFLGSSISSFSQKVSLVAEKLGDSANYYCYSLKIKNNGSEQFKIFVNDSYFSNTIFEYFILNSSFPKIVIHSRDFRNIQQNKLPKSHSFSSISQSENMPVMIEKISTDSVLVDSLLYKIHINKRNIKKKNSVIFLLPGFSDAIFYSNTVDNH